MNYRNHPCFNPEVVKQFGRVHLPVAPDCNIKCNYCSRKYDCVNESRPGVSSKVLSPYQAVEYLRRVSSKLTSIKVAGIAGPGDPFANAPATLQTLELVREEFPDLILCLSTNGFAILPHIEQLVALNVSHITITVNSVNPEVGSKIYAWVDNGDVVYKGEEGAALLIDRQIQAIKLLKQKGRIVKVNTVVIPTINDDHVYEVARTMKTLGVDLMNCIPMMPIPETPFANLPEPSPAFMCRLKGETEKFIPQMRHCQRCRSDAVGFLYEDNYRLRNELISNG